MESPVVARVLRGGITESVHRGSLVVIDGKGNPAAHLGDPELVTFMRSAAKAFQAIPFVTSGAADAYEFSEIELALACASHSGEPFHTELALKMLERAGHTVDDLGCGAHAPFFEETANQLIRSERSATPLHNNCSGKHAAMLAYAKHIGADAASYLSTGSPVQKKILSVISMFSGLSEDEIELGIDGCSAPNFALPLSAMARAYARLICPPDDFDEATKTACRRIVDAKMKYPEYVGGSVRLDTKVMSAVGGRIVCKVGAEGLWLAGILPTDRWPDGLALALKIEDGNDDRARPVVAIELLRQFGLMTREAESILGEFSPLILKNRRDTVVGEVRPDFALELS